MPHPEVANPVTLAARWGAPRVELLGETDSTNDVARALGAAGAPAGTVVLAEAQRSGRGRAGRAWHSPPGLGVWLSLLLRPPLPEPTLLPLLVGLGAARALDGFVARERVRIKWPNDLLVGGRKVGGILCEASWEGPRPAFIVAGIGVNVLHVEADFPAELRAGATSLRLAGGGAAPARLDVAGAIVAAVREVVSHPVTLLDGELAAELDARDALRGQPIVVTDAAGTTESRLAGLALGIAPDGALLVRADGGALRAVRSGTVRLAMPPYPAAASPLGGEAGHGG